MYKRIYLGILLVWSVFHYGQIVLNSPPAPNTEKSDPHSIRLLQGFSFNSTNGTFRAYIGTSSSGNNPYTPINPNYSTNINSNENYIYTREYLVPTTTSNGSLPQIQSIQFFDGLGRPKQAVSIKSTSSGKDLVIHIPYDGFGRQVDSWLPVPMSSLNGNIQTNVESSTNAYYQSNNINDTYPFLHKNLENSPLDRLLSQKNPGAAWQNKPVNFEYDANIAGEVIKYTTTTTWEDGATKSTINHGGTYDVGQLYKNTVTDEDGNKTIEFKNGRGQLLLVRKVLSPTENADTYYVYNEYDQLAWVVPPLLAKMQTWGWNEQEALAYEYRYDGKGRLVEKKLPGKGWEHMVYDKADRLIFTQDAILRPQGKWLFTKYDNFGRVIYTGIILAAPRASLQNTANDYVVTDSRSSTGFTKNGMQVYYTNVLFNEIQTLLSVNYYDTYPTDSPSIPAQILGQNVLSQDAQSSSISTKSLPVASYVKNIEDDNWTKNYTYYDTKGRAIGTHSINHLGGYTKTESLLKFSGKPDYTYTYHKRTANDTELNIKETFEYDHQERVVRHWHQINGGVQELLAENLYNDLGQLQIKNVGNTTGSPLQSINYTYNIRGWLRKINQPSDLGNKLFAYELRYNNPDNQFGGATTAKYNGNISQVSWITQSDAVLRNYSYEYDALNRLKEGRFWDAMNLDRGEYFEQLTYDMNGNVKTLLRRGRQFPGYTAPEVMDDLEYHYENGELSNKLSYLKEKGTGNAQSGYPLPSGVTGSVIGYDPNGNMTTQADKGLSIVYNYLNLPKQITSPQGNTLYTYRADGIKIKKILGTKTTDYLDGFQYENNILKFIPTSEGYYNFENNKYIYNYTDHLGNTRLSYTKNGSGAEIIEENNYYPFGLKHEGYNQLLGNSAYQYKYNGKELQESGMYDYGARFYMPDLGRWGVVDPLAEKMTRHSPYNYAFNNPIRFIDPDGREPGGPGDGVQEIPEVVITKPNWWQRNIVMPFKKLFSKSPDLSSPEGAYAHVGTYTDGSKYGTAGLILGYNHTEQTAKTKSSLKIFNIEGENNSTMGSGGLVLDASLKAAVASAKTENTLGTKDYNIFAEAEGDYIYAKGEVNNGLYTGAGDKYGAMFGVGGEAGALRGEITQGVTIGGMRIGVTQGGCIECGGLSYKGGAWYDNKTGSFNIQGFGSLGIGEGGLKLGGKINIPVGKFLKIVEKVKTKN